MNDPPDIHPWTAAKRIYADRGISIYLTTDPRWVVKEAVDREREIVGRICAGPPIRYCVELPPEPERRMGANWYAMRAYTGSLEKEWRYAADAWRRIACALLTFLEDLHRGHRMVHLDIAARNVLIDIRTGDIGICDFELTRSAVSDHQTQWLDPDNAWFYMSHGAPADGPAMTWRMDLEMTCTLIGGLLEWRKASLHAPMRYASYLSVTNLTETYRTCATPSSCQTSQELMAKLVNHARSWDHHLVRRLRAILDEHLPWTRADPPDAELYEALREVCRTAEEADPSSEECKIPLPIPVHKHTE